MVFTPVILFEHANRPLLPVRKAKWLMEGRQSGGPRGVRLHATGLVLLMLLSLASPLLLPNAAAHEDAGGMVWPMNGSEDTGWVRLNATSTDGIQPASADWNLTFAPGATLDNVSFQIRVSGADGMVIDSPLMISGGSIGAALLDLSDQGWMGQTLDLDGGDPFMGRTSTSGLSSSWTLPGGATVTDLVIQALAPADPTVSLKPLAFEPTVSAVHSRRRTALAGRGRASVRHRCGHVAPHHRYPRLSRWCRR